MTWTQDNDFLFLSLNFDTVVKKVTPVKIANIWRIERGGISAIKFEAARLHFLSNVFVAVAVVDVGSPVRKLYKCTETVQGLELS